MKNRLHTRQFTFRQLEIFRTVVEMGSVTEAAKKLHLAQPTISTQLHKLGQITGAPLFDQIGKRLFLTDVGRDVYNSSRRLFDELDDLQTRLAQREGLSMGTLRISAVTTAKYLVPKWLGQFCQQYPEIMPEFQIGNRAEIIARLQQNLDDLYIFSHPPRELNIEANEIKDNPLVMIAPNEHLLAKKNHLTWEALRGERFLIREQGSGTRYAIEQFFAKHGAPHSTPITIASNEAIKESVVAGLGLAIISRHTLSHMAPGNLCELPVAELPIKNHWFLVTPRGKSRSVTATAFCQCIEYDA